MRVKPVALAILIALVVVAVAGVQSWKAYGNLPSRSHTPIFINGNEGFTLYNGVVAGTGTISDPYIIEGWEIDAHSPNSMEIRNTDAYLVIRKMLIHSATIAGIKLENVSNINVEESTLSFNTYAVGLLGSNLNIAITDNNMTYNGDGIALGGRAAYVTISGDNLSSNGVGIDIIEGRVYGAIYNNAISGNYDGLYAVDSGGHVKVTGNTFKDNKFGIYFSDGEVFQLYHNNIIGNTYQASDCCDVNSWDDGYPGAGNFWSDYRGADRCSGPNQDICPDPDGIGDAPYFATRDDYSVLLDHYPIVKPFLSDLTGKLDVDPNMIVLNSQGKYVTAHIQLPGGFDVANIVLSSIRLNNSLSFVSNAPTTIDDQDHDGLRDLTVKFSLPEVKTLLYALGTYALQLDGNVVMNNAFARFQATDYVIIRSS